MEFLNLPDFISPPSPADLSNIFKSESISIDEDELNTINPDDFLNESFFKTETELPEKRFRSESASSSDQPMQLTPPISPQPIVLDSNSLGIRLIPINTLQQSNFRPLERKIKPILPAKSTAASGSSDSESNVINDNSKSKTSSPVDKVLIKQLRLIRNRESALESRRKKKEYLQNLEVEVGNLRKELYQLKEENSLLKERLKSYGNFTCRCASSISNKISTAKNTSLMLALILMIGFNLVPLGSYFTLTNSVKSKVHSPTNSFNTRHLLFVENSNISNEVNSSEVVAENESIPLYFNQTDRIRKANIENVLRWIPQPDLFNTSNKFYGDYDFSADPFQNKLAKMYEKSRDQMHKKQQPKKKSPKKSTKKNQAAHIQQNLYDPNFFKLHEFYDLIQRKDDTFYVFSFRGEHLLLPALDYQQNFSQIVKMNLIMPRNNDTLSSDKITMMQIETIILNTSLIEVAEKAIPNELMKTYTNSTTTPTMCNQGIKKLSNDTQYDNNKQQAAAAAIANDGIIKKRAAPYFLFDLDSRK